MRDLLIFLALAAAAFFVVGETIGWQLGIAGQTPVYVYKQDGEARAQRRTIRRADMPIRVSGRVRDGAVTVSVIFEDRGSFQANREPDPADVVLEERFLTGQMIAIDEVLSEGNGTYVVRLQFDVATGLFRVPMPNSAEL